MNDGDQINITAGGVSVMIKRTRTLRDEETGELVTVPIGSHRQAVGIGDFKNADDYLARVAELCAPVLGSDMAQLVSLAAAACSERDAAIAEKVAALQTADQARQALAEMAAQ